MRYPRLGGRALACLDNSERTRSQPTQGETIMTDMRTAVTAMLDTEGVHPGDGSWFTAYDAFFTKVKEDTVEAAAHGALDTLNVQNDTVRLQAVANFWDAFNSSRQPSRVKRAAKKTGSKIKEAFAPSSAPNHE